MVAQKRLAITANDVQRKLKKSASERPATAPSCASHEEIARLASQGAKQVVAKIKTENPEAANANAFGQQGKWVAASITSAIRDIMERYAPHAAVGCRR